MSTAVLYLVIRLGADRYALDTAQVIEVVSFVRLKALPGAPAGVAGVMNYRDEAVGVIDLNLIAVGTPTMAQLSTRIVVVEYATGLLGLLVPEATEAIRLEPDEFADASVATDGAPYLGPVITTPQGVIQRVAISALLSDDVRDALFRRVSSA